MAELYDVDTQTSLTPIVESCIPKRQPNLVTNYALDGTFYAQVIGESPFQYDVICYAPRGVMIFIEDGFVNGHIFRVTMKSGTYYGIGTDFQKSYLLQNYYKIEMTLAYVPEPEQEQQEEP